MHSIRARLRRGWLPFALGLALFGAGGVAFAAVTAADEDGITVCIKNGSGELREVASADECKTSEHAAVLAGPGSTVAHAAEADHAATADFATEAGDADTIDGWNAPQLMKRYLYGRFDFNFAPAATFTLTLFCNEPNEVVFNVGLHVRNFAALDPKPILLQDGASDETHWHIRMENRDPDTVIETTLHGACFTYGETPAGASVAGTRGGPAAEASVD